MSLASRLTHLFKADAHGVVDALEDRGLLLRQHVREAAAELARKRCRIDALDSEEKEIESTLAAVGKQIDELEADITLALGADEEKLARFAIKKLLPSRRRVDSLEARRSALKEQRGELAQELERQEGEYEELESRCRGYLARLERGEGGLSVHADDSSWAPVADEEVEIELLRRRRGEDPAAATKNGEATGGPS